MGRNVMIGSNVEVGDNCKSQNNVSIYTGVAVEPGVFVAPSADLPMCKHLAPFLNVKVNSNKPSSKKVATIGVNVTNLCGVTLASFALWTLGLLPPKI